MGLLSFVLAIVVLLGTAVVGMIVHELAHAFALRIAGISCTVELLPSRDDSRGFLTSVRSPLARVTPTAVLADISPWHLRVAAMMPLCLAIPIGLVFVGVVPNPFAAGDRLLELATIAWLGCSIPSPRDFSLLWYPERAIATHRVPASASE